MLNIFKKSQQEALTEQEHALSNQIDPVIDEVIDAEPDTKKVHGQDGVCCGGCGGEAHWAGLFGLWQQ